MSCKHCGVETRYIKKEGRPLQLEGNNPHHCTLYSLLTSFSIIERNAIVIDNPPLRTFKQLANYFSDDEKEEIRKAFKLPHKLKYKYWLMWLNMAINRMDIKAFSNYVRKVDLIDVSERTD